MDVGNKTKRHFLVKGVDDNLKGSLGLRYPSSGPIVAPDWNNGKVFCGGIFGIDWNSFRFHIYNKMYLVIKYNPDQGVIRIGEDSLKIRKGTVVYSSPDIEKIQEWLEAHGDCYRGYGASIVVGDNEKVSCGNECHITAGNNCRVEAGYGSSISCGYRCTVVSGSKCNVITGDDCDIIAYDGSIISAGVGSRLNGGNCGKTIIIDEENSGKTFSADKKGILHEVMVGCDGFSRS